MPSTNDSKYTHAVINMAEMLIAVIGDEDTVTGFLLAGIGHRDTNGQNFLVVDSRTTLPSIEEAFHNFTNRPDIALLLINQHVAEEIRHLLNDYDKNIPTILEIPSKDMPYDPSKDYIMKRVNAMLGLDQ